MTQLAAQDLVAGSVVASRQVRFDEEAFRAFSALTGDAHPIHSDRGYATAKGLPAPLTHGLLLTAMTAVGATTLSPRLESSMVAMLGTEARFTAPVFLGEEIDLTFRIGEVAPKAHNRSVVAFEINMTRTAARGDRPQGERVALVTHRFMLLTRLEAS